MQAVHPISTVAVIRACGQEEVGGDVGCSTPLTTKIAHAWPKKAVGKWGRGCGGCGSSACAFRVNNN